MAGDEILWKSVEAMKRQSPAAPGPAPGRPEMGQKPIADVQMVSPSRGSANSVDTPPSNGTAPAHGSTGISGALQQRPQRLPVQTGERTAMRSYDQLLQVPGRPAWRRPERYAFQFWADQITRLKQLRRMLNLANDPEDGTEVTLSDLVREAMDEYLDRQTQPAAPNDQPVG